MATACERVRELRQAVRRVHLETKAEDADSATLLEEALDDVLVIDEMPRGKFCAEALDDYVIRVCLELDRVALDVA